MTLPSHALAAIPPGLRAPLLDEYQNIIQNYLERRWSPSELSGGLFCEIVYSILAGHAKGAYAAKPFKPSDFPTACRSLEKNTHEPRSFQVLIPRALPPLYEVRNNRNVGHVGGDVDPNHMDATLVVAMCNWVMGELVRVLHGLSIDEAQAVVDALAERRIPLVWIGAERKIVLDPTLTLKNQVLLLLASEPAPISVDDLYRWYGRGTRSNFNRDIRRLAEARLIALHDAGTAEILPPGAVEMEKVLQKHMSAGSSKKKPRKSTTTRKRR